MDRPRAGDADAARHGAAPGDPEQRARRRLRETGRAYVLFALAEPGLFDGGVHVAQGAGQPQPRPGRRPTGPYALLNAGPRRAGRRGRPSPAHRREGADVACWAAVHGFAELHLHGPLRELPADQRDAALEAILEVIDRGLS